MTTQTEAQRLAEWLERRTNIMLQDRQAAEELRRFEAENAELLAALKGTIQELLDVLHDINNDRVPLDGDEFHERLEAGKAAIKKHGGQS